MKQLFSIFALGMLAMAAQAQSKDSDRDDAPPKLPVFQAPARPTFAQASKDLEERMAISGVTFVGAATSTRIGNFSFYNFSNGVSGTSTRIGSFIFHNFSNGVSCSSVAIGSSTFSSCR